MTDERAIETLKRIDIKFFLNGRVAHSNYIVDKADEINIAIETVLNLIQKQQAEIEILKRDFEIVDHECSRLEQEDIRKDKMIDLMADNIYEDDSCLGYYLYRKYGKCTKEMIIEYFKRKVEDK